MRVYETYAQLSAIGAPVFVTVGFFDGVHRGHQHLFARLAVAAQATGAEPLVVTFLNSPKNYHLQPQGDTRPRWRYLTTCEEKLDLLE
jgi:riboflavin kinase/FMN adenylyltransferase